MTEGQNEKDWRLIDEFANTESTKSTKSFQSTSQWFLPLMNDKFTREEGWSMYQKQTLKTSMVYLRKCESDPLKKDRASNLKGLLCERIQTFSNKTIAQNDKVTFKLGCINPLKWG